MPAKAGISWGMQGVHDPLEYSHRENTQRMKSLVRFVNPFFTFFMPFMVSLSLRDPCPIAQLSCI
jgi:hypothetical protein